jgi:hypothetical protein
MRDRDTARATTRGSTKTTTNERNEGSETESPSLTPIHLLVGFCDGCVLDDGMSCTTHFVDTRTSAGTGDAYSEPGPYAVPQSATDTVTIGMHPSCFV